MSSGAYVALSGLRARMEQLDRLAADLANVNTSGYKGERVPTVAAERPNFGRALQSAIDVAPAPGRLDFRDGSLTTTGRALDLGLDGPGFFVLESPAGPRYTRAGAFRRAADGTLTSLEGLPVVGEKGPIKLPDDGEVSIAPDGTVRVGKTLVDRLRIADFENYGVLSREDGARFRATTTATARPANTAVRTGVLEQSNVSLVERMAQLTEVSRGFEALQRGLSVLMNDVYGRAINELGRR